MASRDGARRAAIAVVLGVATWPATANGQETTRVSVDSAGVQGNSFSLHVATSADGGFIAFESLSTNLVAADSNGALDLFVRDRAAGTTERVSVDSSGVEGDDASSGPSLSSDGRFVAFMSYANNLVAGDTNGAPDIFVHDRMTGVTERVSVDSSGVEGNDWSDHAALSADGTVVAFTSKASNLVAGDSNGWGDLFVHDRTTGRTERVSVDSFGAQVFGNSDGPSLSSDGSIVTFTSDAPTLVAGDSNECTDLFFHDRANGITERVSVDSGGNEADGASYAGSISANGQVVAFESGATNLVAGDTNGVHDLFVHDRSSGVTERVSVDSSGMQGDGASRGGSLTPDGRRVAFDSSAMNLVAGDLNQVDDVFLHDRASGATERVSVDSSGAEGNGDSFFGTVSADAQYVAFGSYSTDFVAGDTNNVCDTFLVERCSTDASWSNYGAGFPGTTGIPSFSAQQNPQFGTTLSLYLANSYGKPTVGVIFIGFQRTRVHSGWGGDLLVAPALTLQITFSYGGDSFSGDIPNDPDLCGVTLDLQAIEADPGAAHGVSFTAGLELVIGR